MAQLWHWYIIQTPNSRTCGPSAGSVVLAPSRTNSGAGTLSPYPFPCDTYWLTGHLAKGSSSLPSPQRSNKVMVWPGLQSNSTPPSSQCNTLHAKKLPASASPRNQREMSTESWLPIRCKCLHLHLNSSNIYYVQDTVMDSSWIWRTMAACSQVT